MPDKLPELCARVVVWDIQGNSRYLPAADFEDLKMAIRRDHAFWEGEDFYGASVFLRLSNITDVVLCTEESSALVQEVEDMRSKKEIF